MRSGGSAAEEEEREASESCLSPWPLPARSFSSQIVRFGIATTYLQNEKEQEVGVGNFLELLKKVDRQEGENIVLGGLDAVTL